MSRFARKCLLWVAQRIGEAMRFFAQRLEHGAEWVEQFAETIVEVVEEAIQWVSETAVAKTVFAGYEKTEKLWKATELFSRLDRMTTWIVAFVLGRSCSTLTPASWTASTCAGLYGITFIAMLAGSVFALYMIGQLAQLRL
jgi:hypothetical protein